MLLKPNALILRVPTPDEHASALAHAINHYDVAKFILCPHPYDTTGALGFIAKNAKQDVPAYSIFKDDQLIGGVELCADRELGYWITPSEWGNGYVTVRPAMPCWRAILPTPDAPDVTSGYQPSNQGSAKVQVTLGFRIESHTTDTHPTWGEYTHENTILTREDWMHALSLHTSCSYIA